MTTADPGFRATFEGQGSLNALVTSEEAEAVLGSDETPLASSPRCNLGKHNIGGKGGPEARRELEATGPLNRSICTRGAVQLTLCRGPRKPRACVRGALQHF